MTIKRSTITRRRALTGAATAGLGVPLLAACGGDGGGTTGATDPTSATSQPSSDAGGTGGSTTSAPAEAGGIPTSDVPVGGGVIENQVVITQPTEGDFKAFTAVCTHAQCVVAGVSDGTINCPCHGSRFSIVDGSVAGGPAPSPLAEVGFVVDGDRIVLG